LVANEERKSLAAKGNSSPGQSSLFDSEERNPLAEEGQTFFWSAVFVYQCRMESPEPIVFK
jgi:hypothetical protein